MRQMRQINVMGESPQHVTHYFNQKRQELQIDESDVISCQISPIEPPIESSSGNPNAYLLYVFYWVPGSEND